MNRKPVQLNKKNNKKNNKIIITSDLQKSRYKSGKIQSIVE